MFQSGEHLEVVDAVETQHNSHKEKLIETYQGLPVINEAIVIETDQNGHVTSVNPSYFFKFYKFLQIYRNFNVYFSLVLVFFLVCVVC